MVLSAKSFGAHRPLIFRIIVVFLGLLLRIVNFHSIGMDRDAYITQTFAPLEQDGRDKGAFQMEHVKQVSTLKMERVFLCRKNVFRH